MRLTPDDREWRACLTEASVYKSPHQLQQLFATILVHCAPTNPQALWQDFRHDLAEDFLKSTRDHIQQATSGPCELTETDLEEAWNHALTAIDAALNDMGMSLAVDFADTMPAILPIMTQAEDFDESHTLMVQLQDFIQAQDTVDSLIKSLNKEQKDAFDRIMAAIKHVATITSHSKGAETTISDDDPHLFFIDGPGGSGKTHLYNTLIARTKTEYTDPVVVSSSAIASLALTGGHTAHSVLKIPLHLTEESTCNITLQSKTAKVIYTAPAIFWDEAALLSAPLYHKVSAACQEIMGDRTRPFGGKVVIFGGDFRQVLPIVHGASPEHTVQSCLLYADFWPYVTQLALTRNMRVEAAPENQWFVDYLMSIGDGTIPVVNMHSNYVHIDDHLLFTPETPSPNKPVESVDRQFIHAIYPNIATGGALMDNLDRAILAPFNADVTHLNHLATDMFHHNQRIKEYRARDRLLDDPTGTQAQALSMDIDTGFQGGDPSGLPPSLLQLKEGQPILLLCNINPAAGLCNGTWLIVRRLMESCIVATIATGAHKGDNVYLPQIHMTTVDAGSSALQFERTQFPIKPAFAITINKSQGQTLKHVGVYLSRPVFSHGHLYVALSRCTNPSNLKVYIKQGSLKGKQGTYTKNVVYDLHQ